MRTSVFIAFMALAAISVKVQGQRIARILSESTWFYAYGTIVKDSHTGKTTIKWHSSEDRHVKERDGVWVSNIPLRSIPRRHAKESDIDRLKERYGGSFTEFSTQLTEEDGQTVLHCYMRMPADSITNFWLASDETAIIDYETGTQYRARGCEPKDAWYKYFNFTAPVDSVVDFRIYFPRLPESVETVCIYGVPNWGNRGGQIIVLERERESANVYDEKPKIKLPTLVRQAKDYDKNRSGSWAVYKDAHLIKPVEEGTMALWRTKEATYIAIAHEQNWLREYRGVEKDCMLTDENGNQYKLKSVEGYPLGELYWDEGYSGDFLATFKIFEPLPIDVQTITYIEPDGEPFAAWGANWKGETKSNLSIKSLQNNQKLFEYYSRKVVK